MAQAVSVDKLARDLLGPASESGSGRTVLALAKFAEALRGQRDAVWVAMLLESAAEEVRAHARPGPMPAAERQAWERLGADFAATSAVSEDLIGRAAAHASLLRRSVAGDAALAERLGVTRSRVSQMATSRDILWLTGPDGKRHYPLWQFHDDRLVPGVRDVLAALDPALHPLTVDHWFTTAHDHLLIGEQPLSPRDWLASGGDVAQVTALAAEL